MYKPAVQSRSRGSGKVVRVVAAAVVRRRRPRAFAAALLSVRLLCVARAVRAVPAVSCSTRCRWSTGPVDYVWLRDGIARAPHSVHAVLLRDPRRSAARAPTSAPHEVSQIITEQWKLLRRARTPSTVPTYAEHKKSATTMPAKRKERDPRRPRARRRTCTSRSTTECCSSRRTQIWRSGISERRWARCGRAATPEERNHSRTWPQRTSNATTEKCENLEQPQSARTRRRR